MTRRAITSAVIVATLLLAAPLAHSEDGGVGGLTPDGDAEAQFKYGLAEMLAGRYATGCPALEQSYRLDPRAGALFTLAECDRKAGDASGALARYEQYLALYDRMTPEQRAAQKERAAVAAEERAALQAAAPRSTLVAESHAAPAPPSPQPPLATPAPLPPSASASTAGSRTWAYAVGAVGVAGLVVGGTTAALAMAKRSMASSDCNASGVCASQQGVDAGNAARGLANAATAGFLVGGIALAVSVFLWLTEPSATRPAAAFAGTW